MIKMLEIMFEKMFKIIEILFEIFKLFEIMIEMFKAFEMLK